MINSFNTISRVEKNVNLGEPKEKTLEKGLMSFLEGFMGWKHIWETHKR